jgi:TctA family transporter
MEIVFIIMWVVLSILVGKYAEEHGESKGLIIFISLFTSPLIGFIIAAVNKKR